MAKGRGGLNGPSEGAVGKQVKDYCDNQRAVYEPDTQEQALAEFGGVPEYKNLNRKGKADVSKQNTGQGGGAGYDDAEDSALENADTQEGSLQEFGGVAAGGKFASEEKSGFAADVLSVGKGESYGWNDDSPFYKG